LSISLVEKGGESVDKAEKFLEETRTILDGFQKKSGIDSVKVQRTVSAYLQIARDNQLNYNELLQVFSLTKESVLQSLNKVAISALPDMISDAAKL